MTNYKIGIQLTKNLKKYQYLFSVLKSDLNSTQGLEFIHIPTDEDLQQKIPNLDILTTYYLPEEIFSHATDNLKWVHFGNAGIEKSMHQPLLKSNTIITNASGVHAGPVSEFVMSAILYFAKRVKDCHEFMQTTNWTQWEVAKQMVQLKGKTIGIIGFGSLGKAIAKKAKAFEMNIIATRRLQKKVEHKKTVDELQTKGLVGTRKRGVKHYLKNGKSKVYPTLYFSGLGKKTKPRFSQLAGCSPD